MKKEAIPRFVAILLVLGLTLPESLFALREPSAAEKDSSTLTGLEEALSEGLEEVVVLQPGHPEYERIFGSEADPLEVVTGPLAGYLKDLKEGSSALIRVAVFGEKEKKDWKDLGFQPLIDEGTAWNFLEERAVWPPSVISQGGDGLLFRFVPSVNLAPGTLGPPLEGLSVRPTQGTTFPWGHFTDGFRKKLDSIRSGDRKRIQQVDRLAFLQQLKFAIDRGYLTVAIPFGLSDEAAKGRWTQLLEELNTKVPSEKILSEEGLSRKRLADAQAKRQEEDRSHQEKMDRLVEELASPMEGVRAEYQERLKTLEDRWGLYLDHRKVEELKNRIDSLQVRPILEELLGRGIGWDRIGDEAVSRLSVKEEKVKKKMAALVSSPLKDAELVRAVEALVDHFEELALPQPPHLISVGPQREAKVNHYTSLFGDPNVRSNGWTPARCAMLLEEFRQIKELAQGQLPPGTFHTEIVLAGTLYFEYKTSTQVAPIFVAHLTSDAGIPQRVLGSVGYDYLTSIGRQMLQNDTVLHEEWKKIVPAPLVGMFLQCFNSPSPDVKAAAHDALARRMARGLADHPWLSGPAVREIRPDEPILKFTSEQWSIAVGDALYRLIPRLIALRIGRSWPGVIQGFYADIDEELNQAEKDLQDKRISERFQKVVRSVCTATAAGVLFEDIRDEKRLDRARKLARIVPWYSHSQLLEDFTRLVKELQLRPQAGLEETGTGALRFAELDLEPWGRVEAFEMEDFLKDPRYRGRVDGLDVDWSQREGVVTVRDIDPSEEAPTWTIHVYVHGELEIEDALRARLQQEVIPGIRFTVEPLLLKGPLTEPALVIYQAKKDGLPRAIPGTIAHIVLPLQEDQALAQIQQINLPSLAARAFDPRLPYFPQVRAENFQDDEGYWLLAFFV